MKKMKGQFEMQVVSLVAVAVVILVGLLVFSEVHDVARTDVDVVNESKGFYQNNTGATLQNFTVTNPSVLTGTTNVTAVNVSGLPKQFSLVAGGNVQDGQYNLSLLDGFVQFNLSNFSYKNATMYISYTQANDVAVLRSTLTTVQNTTNDSFILAAVIMIVFGALIVLGLVMGLRR